MRSNSNRRLRVGRCVSVCSRVPMLNRSPELFRWFWRSLWRCLPVCKWDVLIGWTAFIFVPIWRRFYQSVPTRRPAAQSIPEAAAAPSRGVRVHLCVCVFSSRFPAVLVGPRRRERFALSLWWRCLCLLIICFSLFLLFCTDESLLIIIIIIKSARFLFCRCSFLWALKPSGKVFKHEASDRQQEPISCSWQPQTGSGTILRDGPTCWWLEWTGSEGRTVPTDLCPVLCH